MDIRPRRGEDSMEACVPPDKSISPLRHPRGQAKGRTAAAPFLLSDDCLSTLSCLRSLGVEVELDGCELAIEGRGPDGWSEPAGILDAGNSATTMRLLCGALAGRPLACVIDGDASLRRRPMGRIVSPLRAMGADISGMDDAPPPTVRGGRLEVSAPHGVDSAQVKSALLLAGLQARVRRASWGRSSRDHTEMLLLMGADLGRGGYHEHQALRPRGLQDRHPRHISAPPFSWPRRPRAGSHLRLKEWASTPGRDSLCAQHHGRWSWSPTTARPATNRGLGWSASLVGVEVESDPSNDDRRSAPAGGAGVRGARVTVVRGAGSCG